MKEIEIGNVVETTENSADTIEDSVFFTGARGVVIEIDYDKDDNPTYGIWFLSGKFDEDNNSLWWASGDEIKLVNDKIVYIGDDNLPFKIIFIPQLSDAQFKKKIRWEKLVSEN